MLAILSSPLDSIIESVNFAKKVYSRKAVV